MRIWDRERGVVVTEIAGAEVSSPGLTVALAFDPSGRLIAFAGGRQVRIWDVETGALVATLPGQPAEILAVVFSPDGASVATGASDGTVRLFDVRSETERLVLHGPDAVRSVAFSPDGSLLASVDGTTVRVWVLDIDTCSRSLGRTSRGRSPTRNAVSTFTSHRARLHRRGNSELHGLRSLETPAPIGPGACATSRTEPRGVAHLPLLARVRSPLVPSCSAGLAAALLTVVADGRSGPKQPPRPVLSGKLEPSEPCRLHGVRSRFETEPSRRESSAMNPTTS